MKVVALADIHSGDSYGLADPANVPKKKPGHAFAAVLFDWYKEQIKRIGAIDALLCAGELTEGPGNAETIELWSTDMEEQAEACADLLCMWPCNVFHLCYSTPFHASGQLRSDNLVVKALKARRKTADIRAHQRRRLGGVPIDVFHYVGGSATPYGFASQLMKAGVTDAVRGLYRGYQPAKLYLRGHTHVYGFAGNDMLTVINLPSLKWPLGAYGLRIDRAYYAMGLTDLEFADGVFDWNTEILRYKLPEERYA